MHENNNAQTLCSVGINLYYLMHKKPCPDALNLYYSMHENPCSDGLNLYYLIHEQLKNTRKKNSRKQSSINNSNQHHSRHYKLVEVKAINYDYCSRMLTISFICSQLSPHKTQVAQPMFNQRSTSTPTHIATHRDSATYEDIQPIR